MAMSGKERQKKWQERQKIIGKKRVTVILDKDALAVLEEEKARTGESFSRIISQAVVNMNKIVSDNEIIGRARGEGEAVSDNESIDIHTLMERIVTLIGVVGLSEEEVAERLIDENVTPPSHQKTWCAETVKALYTRSIL